MEIPMKKMNSKKLHLNADTLRILDGQGQLERVAGGVLTQMVNCSADITSCNGCNTRNTCTTRYC
jgi:hypothetical protein